MRRKVVAVWVSLLIMISSIVILVEIAERVEAPTTLYVGGGGPGNYSKIQWAIDNASDGDTVFVYSGTYYENIIVDKTINLNGENRDTTIIDGSGPTDVVLITQHRTNVSDFTVRNGYYGIYVENADRCNVSSNNLSDNSYGIHLYQSFRNNITNNHASNNGFGIYLYNSRYNHIYDNNASNNDNRGLIISYSHENNIKGNHLFKNDIGISLGSSENNIILDNMIKMNNRYGISIDESNEIIVSNNMMINNGVFVSGDMLEHWNSHEIDVLNTINAKPLYFWKDQTTGIIPIDAGQVILANCTNIIIENQSLYNASIGVELGFSSNNIIVNNTAISNFEAGIYLYLSNNNTIANNTCSNNRNGISLDFSSINVIEKNNCSNGSTGIDFLSSENNKIEGNILNNNAFGVYFHDSYYNIIGNNSCSFNSLYGIYLYAQSFENVLENNTCINNKYGIYLHMNSDHNIIENNNCSYNDDGIRLSTSNNVIKNNECSYNGDGIHLSSGNVYNLLENNTLSGNHQKGISLFYSSSIMYANKMEDNGIYVYGDKSTFTTQEISTNNTVNGKPVYYYKSVNMNNATLPSDAGQIILGDVSWLRIENVDVSSATAGIQIGYSSNIHIANSTSSHHYMYGIRILYSSSIRIYNTECLNNSGGIYFGYSSNSTIESCNSSNNINSIYLEYSDQNIIKDNNCLSGNNGIRLDDSANNIIKNNTCSNNEDGIILIFSLSNNNIIYHNNILNNTNQAYDSGTNRWDNGYPLGGNYWSDYSGVDNYKGPNQNVLGKDGIGDTPYTNIGGFAGAKDNYPLMAQYKPLENYTVLKPGWNLISIPLIQDEQNLTRVLGSIDGWYDAVQWYDTTDTSDPWMDTKIGKPFGNEMYVINESMGIWVHITNTGDTVFLYNGTIPSVNQTIQLHPGWNMVGYPSLSNHNRTMGLNNLEFGTDVDAIQWYDAATKTWHFMGPDDSFVPGRGYWMHSKVDTSWEVPL
jgi:parallel beta-helix repeat protein